MVLPIELGMFMEADTSLHCVATEMPSCAVAVFWKSCGAHEHWTGIYIILIISSLQVKHSGSSIMLNLLLPGFRGEALCCFLQRHSLCCLEQK